jgi:hypothetical protein
MTNALILKAQHFLAKNLIVETETTDEIAAERMAVCMNCEHRKEQENKCGVCGCFLDLKTKAETNLNPKKARTEITHCPLGKWGDLEITNFYRVLDGKQPIE